MLNRRKVAIGFWLVEVRDGTIYPRVHKIAPHPKTKNYPAQNISGVKPEKLEVASAPTDPQ